MKVLKEEIKIREGEDRKFIISLVTEDEITAEEFNVNFKGISDSLTNLKKSLEGLDAEKEKRKEFMEKDLAILEPKFEVFKEFDQKARIWADLNTKENERKQGVKPVDEQQSKAN